MPAVKVLFVAEKPKVAKSMAQVLKGQQMRSGTSPQNPIHECRGEIAFNQEPPAGTRKTNMPHLRNPAPKHWADIRITSVAGHIMEMDFKGANRKWHGCANEDLFDAEVEKHVPEKFEACAKQLKEQACWADWLVIWTDYDREGENIGFEIIDICTGRGGNRNLRVHRCGKFSSINEESMEHAMLYCKAPDRSMSDAVEARMELDLRTGAAFTRFQTMLLQNRFDETQGNSVISYGPCQFPCMGFVVANHKRIVNFREETFWRLELSVKGNAHDNETSLEGDNTDDMENGNDFNLGMDAGSGSNAQNVESREDNESGENALPSLVGIGTPLRFDWTRNRVYDRAICTAMYQMAMNAARPKIPTALITSVTGSPSSKQRPAPLNTIKLQVEASRHLRLGAEETMAIADKLYQEQKLSYPRTETNNWPADIDPHPLVSLQRGHTIWGGYAAALLDQGKFRQARDGGETDNSHPPIHPIKLCQPNEFSDVKDRHVYELVTRCFLATFSDDARGQRTSIRAMVGGESFTASGTMVTERNYLDIYRYDKWTGNTIPVFLPGRSYVLDLFAVRSGQTVPPSRLHESELIKRMDNEGIGTDATAAAHIETIQKRNYVSKDQDLYFSPTELGLALADGYEAMGRGNLIEAKLRKQQEQDCVAIERHGRSKNEVLSEQRATMKKIFQQTQVESQMLLAAAGQHLTHFGAAGGQNQATVRVLRPNFSACGKCGDGQMMDLKSNSTGNNTNPGGRDTVFLHCSRCFQTCFVPGRGNLKPVSGELCPICNFQVVKVEKPNDSGEYFICPYCYKNPPTGSREATLGGDMPCFKCSHGGCPRAGRAQGSDIPVMRCRSCCTHDIVLQKNSKGRFSVSCAGYREEPRCSAAVWLPAKVESAAVLKDVCNRCSSQMQGDSDPRIVRKIRLTCSRRFLRPGFLDGDGPTGTWDVCLICHKSNLSEIEFGASYKDFKIGALPISNNHASAEWGDQQSNSSTFTSRPGGGSEQPRSRLAAAALGIDIEDTVRPNKQQNTGSGRDVGGRRGEVGVGNGNLCYRCNQPGHWARDCPNSVVTRGSNGGSHGGGTGGGLAPDGPLCSCNASTILLTVRKEGPNTGRKFYKCAAGNGSGCNFFQWMEDN